MIDSSYATNSENNWPNTFDIFNKISLTYVFYELPLRVPCKHRGTWISRHCKSINPRIYIYTVYILHDDADIAMMLTALELKVLCRLYAFHRSLCCLFRWAVPQKWWADWEWGASSEPLHVHWCWRWTRRRSALPYRRGRETMRVMEGQMGTGKPCTGGTCTGGTCTGSRESDGPSKNRGFQRMPWTSDRSTAQRVTFKQHHRTQN